MKDNGARPAAAVRVTGSRPEPSAPLVVIRHRVLSRLNSIGSTEKAARRRLHSPEVHAARFSVMHRRLFILVRVMMESSMIRSLVVGSSLVALCTATPPSANAMPTSVHKPSLTVAEPAMQTVGYRRGRRHTHREHCTHYGDHDHCHTDHIVTRERWHGDHYHVESRRYHDQDDHVHEHHHDHHD